MLKQSDPKGIQTTQGGNMAAAGEKLLTKSFATSSFNSR